MSIAYTYEIVSVDQAARCMEIVYSSEGRQSMHIGARLPFEGESLESVVEMYSPVALWLAQEAPVIVPVVGTTGTMSPVSPQVQQEAPQGQHDMVIEPVNV